jgi:hypothetical protein
MPNSLQQAATACYSRQALLRRTHLSVGRRDSPLSLMGRRVWHNGATTYQTAAAQRTKWRPDHNHKATVVVRPPRTKSTKPTILLFIIYYLPFAPAVSYQTTTRHWPLAIIQSNKQKVGLTNDETVLEPK